MFNTLNYRALTNPEFQQFIKLLVEKATEAGVDTLKIKTPHDLLTAILAKLEAALNQEKANEETKILQDLDGDRFIPELAGRKKGAGLRRLFVETAGRPRRLSRESLCHSARRRPSRCG